MATNISGFLILNMSRESRIRTVPWPLPPRPFYEEAFGGWLGRVAARYQISVEMPWKTSISAEPPALGTAGWILFPVVCQPMPKLIVCTNIPMLQPTHEVPDGFFDTTMLWYSAVFRGEADD